MAGFQAGMPVIGYFLGSIFEKIVVTVDHWIAFVLLSTIGISMIKEALNPNDEDSNESISFKTMIILSIATSIDALAVGITFAFLEVNLILAITLIGIITFALSVIGTKIGNKFGNKYENKAQILGGIILILLGIKILLGHLGILVL